MDTFLLARILLSCIATSECRRTLLATMTLGAVLMISGCGTIFDGTSQTLTLNTYPSGAQCEIIRREESLRKVTSTPSSVRLTKSKHAISIICEKTEYQTQQKGAATLESLPVEEWTIFNYISLGLFWLIDTITAANRQYPSEVWVTLE